MSAAMARLTARGFSPRRVVNLGGSVVGEQVGAPHAVTAGELLVVADVAAGFLRCHAGHLVADRDPLVEGYLQPQLTCL